MRLDWVQEEVQRGLEEIFKAGSQWEREEVKELFITRLRKRFIHEHNEALARVKKGFNGVMDRAIEEVE